MDKTRDEKIIKAAEQTIIEAGHDDEPTVWGVTTANEVIDNLKSFYNPETPDYKYWADNELFKERFSFENINYIVFVEANGDGWHVITEKDFEEIENAD